LTKGGIHIGDASLKIERPHAGEHGVFHRPSEIGFSHQRFLGLYPAAGVTPGAQQHPDSEHTERADQPEKSAAHHPQ
jgi:hypothetical protein